MKKVCGTCIFGYDCEAGKSGIIVICAFDNEWCADNSESCIKWEETRSGLSKKDRLDLAKGLKDEERKERYHQELLNDSKANRKNQIILVIIGTLLGILGTLLSQYIWSFWIK
jgi:hypothetical protein